MIEIRAHTGRDLLRLGARWEAYVANGENEIPLSRHPAWLQVLRRGLGHTPYCLEASDGEEVRGTLPLVHVQSLLFGRFLVSLPYLNYGGVIADDELTARLLIERAIRLADELEVRYLELRHERAIEHPLLPDRMTNKVHMRLALPDRPEKLWSRLSAKVRNLVRKGQKSDLTVHWGGAELLDEFYGVFSRNMRDLGTPAYGRKLFQEVLRHFPDRAEFCVVRAGFQPVAGALLLHGWNVTEVPSASALREFNHTSANMLMYWHLLQRAILRGRRVFDFGRSTLEGNTYRFKKQWGAAAFPAVWQYYTRVGARSDLRPENPRYQRLIHIWQRLPLSLTRLIGPAIVRGIP